MSKIKALFVVAMLGLAAVGVVAAGSTPGMACAPDNPGCAN